MSISLNGLKPKDTYQALIKVGDNTIVTTINKTLSDGQGNDLPMEVSTLEINFTGLVKQSGITLATTSQLNLKQDTLVSGTNIKSINGSSVLGSGNLVVSSSAAWGLITGTLSTQTDLQSALDSKQATLISATNIKTINGTSVLGSGDIAISTSTSWGSISGTLSSQTDLQTALNNKITANVVITGATKTKVTYDSKGLVTSGADATTSDIADSTNKRYVTDAQLVVIGNTSNTNSGDNATNSQYSGLAASKQDTLISGTNIKTINSSTILGSGDLAVQSTLVSGTNIKTINSTSLLGSGDIAISASPSGVAGAIQFSNGSAFSSDATNLFWDDTNNKLGIGTNTPTARLSIKGSGSTSATNSLRIENSTNSQSMYWDDSGKLWMYSAGATCTFSSGGLSTYSISSLYSTGGINLDGSAFQLTYGFTGLVLNLHTTTAQLNKPFYIGNGTLANANASSLLELNATDRGLLLPRMTTTQKNAIVTPATGLMVYDTDLLSFYQYNGTAWVIIGGSSGSPSGTTGAIQFNNGGVFGADDTNLFWDNTSKELGVGINTPTASFHTKGTGTTNSTSSLKAQNNGTQILTYDDSGVLTLSDGTNSTTHSSLAFGSNLLNAKTGSSKIDLTSLMDLYDSSGSLGIRVNTAFSGIAQPTAIGQTTAPSTTAILELASTTRGFLPPRMTTTQRDAITSPPDGLIIYNTSSKSINFRSNGVWEDIGSQTNARTSASSAINTTETILVSSPVLSAGRFMTSTFIKIAFTGTNTSSVAGTSTFRVRIGTAGTTADTLVFTATTANSAASGTAVAFSGEIIMTIRTIGASATAYGTLKLWNAGSTGISTVLTQVINGTMTTFDSTTANFVSLSYLTSATTTTSTFQQSIVEIID